MASSPAVALLEFDSVAIGVRSGDAMVKRAPVAHAYSGTIQPGKYLVLVGGDTASVEEAIAAGTEAGAAHLVDLVYLPDVHPDVIAALTGSRERSDGDAVGVVETRTVAATIEAADAGIKAAAVTLGGIRIGDGLGGKGYVVFSGPVADVEEAVAAATARLADPLRLADVVIPQLHEDMAANLWTELGFHPRLAVHRAGG